MHDKVIVLRDKNKKAYRILNVIKDYSAVYFYQEIDRVEREIMEMTMRDDTNLKEIINKYILKIEAPLARLMGLADMILDPNTNETERSMAFDFFKASTDELDKTIHDIVMKSKEINKY